MTDQQMLDSYEAKEDSYFTNPRRDYVDLLPRDPDAAILELGCGDGATGVAALSEGKCGRYVGIEMFEPMAQRARAVLSEVHIGNVETMALPYAPGTFDALILSEVLEHLVDPYATLARLVTLLKPGGRVMASSPNIAHWSNVLGLMKGRFRYTDSGMMDRTHLRWFTPESFRAMFEEAGVTVEVVKPFGGLTYAERAFRKIFKPFAAMVYFQIDLHGRYDGPK